MKSLTLLLLCGLLVAVAIALAEAQTSKKTGLKGKAVKNLIKKKATTTTTTTTTPPPKKKKKKKNNSKANLQQLAVTPFDEFAPDTERGTDCYDACYPNSTFLDSAGKILNPGKYGEFQEVCGKTYLFGKKAVTWKENWQTCCHLGMMPIIFDSLSESQCLFKETNVGDNSATAGKAFWTGGFKHELNAMWAWCTKDSPEPIDESMTSDILGDTTTEKPIEGKKRAKVENQDFNCLLASFEDSVLSCNLCNAKEVYLGCESVDKLPADLLPDNSKCKANCNAHTCEKNKDLFVLNAKQELQLEERYKYGRWVSKCGRYFLFSSKPATYDEARQKCCSYGTSLLSIKTAAKRRCLSKLTKDYPDVAGEFWTSGTDGDCDGNYRWCSVDRAFLKKEVLWAPNNPSQKKGNCVSFRAHTVASNSTVQTDDCKVKKRFICEVRQSGTTVEAVQKECASLLGLTSGEVDGLNNTGNYTYKMKCYLRCIGDNLGMLINGTLQEGNVMKLMEKSNEKGDTDKGYEAIDICKKQENKTDDCQSAYQMYKCGKEKAPTVFGKMIVHEDKTSPKVVAPVEIQTRRECYFSVNNQCGENRTLQKTFSSTSKTPDGIAVTGWNGLTWFKSNYKESHSYENAYVTCCQLGMRLPVASTLADFKKAYDNMGGNSRDNFWGETYTTPEFKEKWCSIDVALLPEMSADGFRLMRERSFLYSQKNYLPKYKLNAVDAEILANDIKVNHFYCEPAGGEE